MSEWPVFDMTAVSRLERIGGTRLVRQLVEMYLSLGPERLTALKTAAEANDAGGVERAAHNLKSSAGNVGAVRLQHAAAAVEDQASAGVVPLELTRQVAAEYEESAVLLRALLEENVES